jgi:hypothetical protein
VKRLGIEITEEMDSALKRVAKKQGATVANLVRMGIIRVLKENGEEIPEPDIQWGGDRRGTHIGRPGQEREELRELADILSDRSLPDDLQLNALNKLLEAKSVHRVYLSLLLRKALRAHLDGYGPVQREIVRALGEVGDTSAISVLERMQANTTDPNVRGVVDPALEQLINEKRLEDELHESRQKRRQLSNRRESGETDKA